ncbi:unnamed protein product [Citrullus colocynthis]|uniref:Uncharacterized protein n=1 Tax=Citrullus colocynthis TaxID=252529 RepID=A0ABP0Y772_9ROSI
MLNCTKVNCFPQINYLQSLTHIARNLSELSYQINQLDNVVRTQVLDFWFHCKPNQQILSAEEYNQLAETTNSWWREKLILWNKTINYSHLARLEYVLCPSNSAHHV